MRFLCGMMGVCLAVMPLNGWGAIVLSVNGLPVSQNFDALSSTDLLGLDGGAWRLGSGASPTFADGSMEAGLYQTSNLTSNSVGNSYVFRDPTNHSDRAIGFLASGSTATRSVMVELQNNLGTDLEAISISFDYEKFRSGTRAFNLSFFTSIDGLNWSANALGDQHYPGDANNTTTTASSIPKSFTLSGLNLGQGASYFLRWHYAGVGGSSNGQALAIDNFQVTGFGTSSVPEPSSLILLAFGGCGGLLYRYRRVAA